jgi:hypothetical protein
MIHASRSTKRKREKTMSEASWTWMIYMATHNNAAGVGAESVARMRQAKLSDQVRVLVQEATPDSTVRRIIGADPEVAADLGQIDSGAPDTLLDFIRWAAQAAPAKRYALVLWSHGSGWAPTELARLAQQQPAAVPVTAAELTQRGPEDSFGQLFFSSSLRQIFAKPTPADRAIAKDDGTGHSLDTIELGRAIGQAARSLGRSIDLVGMNACQMSSAEVAYQLRGSAEVYVASQENMPAYGWPYEDLLPRLVAQPDMPADDLGKLAVERYCAYFQANPLPWGQGGLPAGVTLSAVKLDGIPRLAGAAGQLAGALRDDMPNLFKAVWAAHRKAYEFSKSWQLYDLGGFCSALAAAPGTTPTAAAAAKAVLDALADPAVMLACQHLGAAYDGTAGLTTYLAPPGTGITISPAYAETAYAKNTSWGEFLAAYHAEAE